MTGPNPVKSGDYWKVAYRDQLGRRRWKSLGNIATTSKAAAKRRALDWYSRIAATPGLRDVGPTVRLGQWVEDYLELRMPDVADSTLNLDRQTCDVLLEFFGSDIRCDRITAADADDWRRWMLKHNDGDTTVDRRPATVASHTRRAKCMFERLRRRGSIVANPFADLPGSAVTTPKPITLTADDIPRMLAACPTPGWRGLVAVVAYAGLRLGEALSITWEDVKWGEGRLVVQNHKTASTTGAAHRVVKMEPDLERVLLDCREQAQEARIADVGRNNLHRDMLAIARRAGVADYPKPFHAWRAWRSTTWKAQYPEHVVDSWLGHSRTVARGHYNSVPDDYYGIVNPREAAMQARIRELEERLKCGNEKIFDYSGLHAESATVGDTQTYV